MKRGPEPRRLSDATYRACDRIVADLLAEEATRDPDAPPTVFGFPIVINPAMPEDEVRLQWPGGGVRITGIGRGDG